MLIKRLFDVVAVLVFLPCLLPLLLLLSLLILIVMGRPVLFKQKRPGLYGKTFTMCKFRTMRDAFDENGEPLADELRLGRFGKFLRSTSLDELPELWNVLKGDMSLVGPRPLLEEYLPLYSTEQARRHDIKPGLTGWAQVNGRNAISWREKLSLDVWYVDNQSFLLDMKIIFLTLKKVVQREGIISQNSQTMEKFKGDNYD